MRSILIWQFPNPMDECLMSGCDMGTHITVQWGAWSNEITAEVFNKVTVGVGE